MPNSSYCRSHQPGPAPNPAGPGPGNQNAQTHGVYSQFFDGPDLVALSMAGDPSLLDEIAFTRVVIRRLACLLNEIEHLNIDDATTLANALFRGTGRVAALLKTERAISGDAADGIAGAIAQALDELSTEWNIDL